ncbi:YdcF family protein [Curtobacterium flaccumfaciens]|uniref:YdcF family protein n=1 Tax=Curtobacterium flaccumfaciens TaxID=2035 RepID=UPI0014152C14|nr:YdcF family protein [Curtobacterium flaccumfaciens]
MFVGVVCVGAATLLWGEAVHGAAAVRARRLPPIASGASVAVVVLGFRNGGTRANIVNRWRARIGVRTARAASGRARSVVLVTSGGAVHGTVSEADLLRDYITGSLHWTDAVLVDRESTSTWENVRNVIPLVDQADGIVFASNGLHAEKARIYLARQRPDLAERLAAADDYRAGEMSPFKPLFAAVGLRKLHALRKR